MFWWLPNVVGMNYQDAMSLLVQGLESISTICNDCQTLQDTLSAVVLANLQSIYLKTVERAQQIVVLINAGQIKPKNP